MTELMKRHIEEGGDYQYSQPMLKEVDEKAL